MFPLPLACRSLLYFRPSISRSFSPLYSLPVRSYFYFTPASFSVARGFSLRFTEVQEELEATSETGDFTRAGQLSRELSRLEPMHDLVKIIEKSTTELNSLKLLKSELNGKSN